MRKHETQSCSESCVFSFSNPILYTALHNCALSTLWQCLPQFLTIIVIIIIILQRSEIEYFCKSLQFRLFKRRVEVTSVKVRKVGNKKRATCLATLLQNELNSDVVLFTKYVQTC